MKRIIHSPDFIELGQIVRNLLIIGISAIPVYIIATLYLRSKFGEIAEHIAIWAAFCFFICVFVGRYASKLFVRKNGLIPPSTFKILGSIIIICMLVLYLLAESITSFSIFLTISFIGLPFIILSITLGLMVKLIRTAIKIQLTEAKAEAEQSQSELRFLQSQLSPHFLFNTLNNMYGLSLSQHEKIPGLLLKLSDLLRYSIYDAKELYVPLVNEAAYIQGYIEFEKIRIGDKLELNVCLEEPIDPDIKIAPLLMIVFVENAFKHSKNTTQQNIRISITLKTWAHSILFSVTNSCHSNDRESTLLKKNSGFGLQNVMKRLDLLYKNKYDLNLKEENDYYTVTLQLKTK